MAWIQMTAYEVLGSVQWVLASGDSTEVARKWTVLGQGLEDGPGGPVDELDVAWLALLAAMRALEARSR